MLVAGCISASVLAFAHAALLDPGAPGRKRALLAAYLLCALGVLSKGLIGVVLPGMVIFLWLSWERRWSAMVRLLWVPGAVLFFLVDGPWFVLMQERSAGFAHYFFVVQQFQRYSQSTFNNPQPFYFYPVVLLVLGLPWTIWLWGCRTLRWRGTSQDTVIRRLMLVWASAITLFFSMPHSKLVGYILPVAVPMLYLAAEAGLALRRERLWKASGVAAALLCLGALTAVTLTADRSQAELGHVLRDRMQPGDSVIALEQYRFAIPFEARLIKPMVVVSDWSSQGIGDRDDWRKELADAAAFDPRQDWLITASEVPARVCASPASWLIGPADIEKKYPWLALAQRVMVRRNVALWRVDAASPVRPALCLR